MPENNSIGAMWVKQGKNGPFYSGYIEINGQKLDIIAFKNDTSKNPKAPSLRILKGTPRPTTGQPMTQEVDPKDIPF